MRFLLAVLALATVAGLAHEIRLFVRQRLSDGGTDRQGRVFLTGDACHLHPPFGGFGMNMGIADSVDLGWKIAAVLQGWGGPQLLDSYEAERRPAHESVLDEAHLPVRSLKGRCRRRLCPQNCKYILLRISMT